MKASGSNILLIDYLPFAGEYIENQCREALELIYHIIVPGPAYEKHMIIN